MKRQRAWLNENRDAMDQIADFLIEKETITGKEFMKIFRKVKGIPEPEETPEEENGLPDTEHLKAEDDAAGAVRESEPEARPEHSSESEAMDVTEPAEEKSGRGYPISGIKHNMRQDEDSVQNEKSCF